MARQNLEAGENTGVFRGKLNSNFTELYSKMDTDSKVRLLTAGWVGGNSAYTTVNTNSATKWNYQGTDIKNLTAGWVGGNSAYTTVNTNSATTWNYQGTDIKNLTAGWVGGNSAYTTVWSKSANWDAAFNSTGSDLGVRALTAGWVGGNSAYTTVWSKSANWDTTYTTVNTLSTNWTLDAVTNYLSNNTVTIKGINVGPVTETKATPSIISNVLTIDLNTAALFYVSLNANITTLTLTNVPTSPKVYSFTLQLLADGTPRTVAWPPSFRWASGTAPTITSTLDKIDTFTFMTHDGGTNWFAYISDQNQ